jgi:hypothetical protein
MNWQPIETAPIGEIILVLCEDYKDEAGKDIFQAVYEKVYITDWEFVFNVPMPSDKRGTYEELCRNVTHWMPLPKPPQDEPK